MENSKQVKERLWALFHRKWTRDVGTEGYHKEEWKELDSLIQSFITEVEKSQDQIRQQGKRIVILSNDNRPIAEFSIP